MQTVYTSLKVNNEYELCEVYSQECKDLVEKGLLKDRISYFMRYPKVGIFSRHKYICVFCVNESSIARAEEIVNQVCADGGYEVKFLVRKSQMNYL
jgi:hypothetical protein